jgi:hypothetical protein
MNASDNSDLTLDPIAKLTKDLRTAAAVLSDTEARYLVDLYYQIQGVRIAAGNQVSAMTKANEPALLIAFEQTNMAAIEKHLQYALRKYCDSRHMGVWAMGVTGIGPVLAAGLLAHIDIEKAPTVGHIWRFAGLDPTAKWERGQKRPHNAALKVVCWKIGESFVKVSGIESDVYGKIYLARKAYEQALNDAGQYAAQAEAQLRIKKIGKSTEAYKHYAAGKLPPGHLHARAKRYSVKLFLSHWHAEAYRDRFKREPPLPYPIAHLGHAHVI